MNWQILLSFSVLSYAGATLAQRLLLKDAETDPVAVAIFEPILTSFLVCLFIFWKGFSFNGFGAILPNIALMTAIYAAGSVFYFKAVKLIEASEFTIVFTARSLFTIAGATLILGEKFNLLQMVGALLIIVSIVVISFEKKRAALKFRKGELYAISAAILFGLGFVNDAYILQRFDATLYLVLTMIFPALGVWVFNPKAAVKAKVFLNMRVLPKLVLLSSFFAVSGVSYFLAYQDGHNAAQLSALDQTATIIAVVLAIIFLRERDNLWKKVIGAIISFIGVLLLR